MTKPRRIPIEIQAACALILIQLAHKLVAELPGARSLAGTTVHPMVFTLLIFCVAYVVALVACFMRVHWGFIIGIVLGVEIILQPIIFHVILRIPKDPLYYIFFPILQGILIAYFCWLGYRAVKGLNI
jgi:hypothetical protein